MERKDLAKIIDEIFIPIHFKRKGNHWVLNAQELNKIINLQKSQYGNSFYINYGYIINSIPLEGFRTHIFRRLGSPEINENKRLADLLDLGNDISDEERISELKFYIKSFMLRQIQSVNTENDILNYLKTLENLNTIPIVVKKHFNLDDNVPK